MRLHAGALDRRITIETRVRTRDTRFGAEIMSWVPLRTVWAKKQESSVTPQSNPGVPEGVVTYARPCKYWVRWLVLDKAASRINDNGRILEVTGTAELGRREWLELACKEWAHGQQ